jgi:hypothetical protein
VVAALPSNRRPENREPLAAQKTRRARGRLSNARGAARTGLLAWTIAALALALALVVWLAREPSEPNVTPPIAAATREAVRAADAPEDSSAHAATERSSASAIAASPPESSAVERVRGRGTIRGRITAVPGLELPKVWTLIVEPHPYLQGRERAVTRRIEFSGGEQEFKVDGLPLAGYCVRARAPGLNDVTCSALLVPGSSDVFVSPQFRPSGFVDGTVLEPDGTPAEGVSVTLSSDSTHVRTSTVTDASGAFAIANVADDNYTLFLGPPDAPLVKPDSLSFTAPSMRVPTHTLPDTGSVRVTAVDLNGRALSDVPISGFSSSAGALSATTDARGAASVHHLLPGRYRVDARIEDGRKAGAWVEVEAKRESVLQLTLK